MLPLAYFGSPSQWLIFAIICLVVFGASRLPEIARNLGKSLGILRRAKREFEQELMREQETPQKSARRQDSPASRRNRKTTQPRGCDSPCLIC